MEVIKLFEYKRNDDTIYNAVLKLVNDSYMKIIMAQKVNIGWEKCRVEVINRMNLIIIQ